MIDQLKGVASLPLISVTVGFVLGLWLERLHIPNIGKASHRDHMYSHGE